MKKYLAEFIGTFALVLFGCGTVVIAGNSVGILGIAFAFGFAQLAMCYGVGPISGAHINPAVSLGVFTAGRMSGHDLLRYIISQFLGGIAGAAVVWAIASGRIAGYSLAANGLGQDGWGAGFTGGYDLKSAMIFEFVATIIFVIVILGSTQGGAPTALAGVAIGITLTAIHILGINVTGVSVNPARSLGPAVFVRAQAIAQVWMFLVVPSIGGIVAGLIYRARALALASAKAV